ncbi:AAA family ATPase [Candidatus Poribacteria bacterium]|nr:AAA family ATPase [Candidatus Poribacteria bacterium]MYB64025.1 AAA family ATPase [Candidatus Poribacteria bacterium]MYF56434.1 AAA family ATPase [Candidatus Poribacteria bacterium]MYI95208.1 AAA family ATPase [Candidatus Poribacteria bacterium]
MKLISAKFQNFRLLRDLRLDFATSDDRKLTVIRASNESGKTTILNALQWALYGDNALPNRGRGYRLFPIDWDAPDGRAIPITVQVVFEVTTSGLNRNTTNRYRVIRSVEETTDGHRQNPKIELFEVAETGANPIRPPEAQIARLLLPPNLREVFFTDGDRALSFIESDSPKVKREQVQEAIRSLLELDVIEAALDHLKKTIAALNKDSKNIGSDTELTQIATELEEIDKKIEHLENERDDVKQQFDEVNQSLTEIQRDIETALVKGDQEKLNLKLKKVETELNSIRDREEKLVSEHSQLFRNPVLFRDLLAPVLEQSFEKLNELRDQGKLPSPTIPVLVERLRGVTCICGESLDKQSEDGKRRREHIERLITESRRADELQKCLTDLYYGSLVLNPKDVTNDELWITEYSRILKDHDELESQRMVLEKDLAALEVQLEEIGDTDIQKLRSTKQDYTGQRDRLNDIRIDHERELERLKERQRSLTATHNNLITKHRRGTRILARLDATRDISQVLQNSYKRITNEELQNVSQLMNTLFLEMIGADAEQGPIIQNAEISKDFDILVYGPNERALNPDQDLNGASRRALTIAFILALTKVSEVAAPNVIDTPLGMMDGFVKRSVLKTVIQESSQLILFLTRSEIKDCEDIILDKAGRIITITNSAHYPNILVNDPHINEPQAVRCKCEDLGECDLCMRRTDVEEQIQVES